MFSTAVYNEEDYFEASNLPGGEEEDDDGLEEADWNTDLDDEAYEDELEDDNDLNEIKTSNGIFDPDDDDHLPDDDF